MAVQNVKLPDVGEGVTEGELVRWLVKIGDTVKADQPVVELMTDKATVEVPTPYAGVVKELKYKEGDVVPIESVMLVLETDGAGAAKAAPAAASAPASASTAAKQPPAGASAGPAPQMQMQKSGATSAPSAPKVNSGSNGGMDVVPPPAGANVLATPATRRLARESGVDLNQVSGTGLAGRVTRDDVANAKSGGGAPASNALVVPGASKAPLAQIPKPSYSSQPGAHEERVPLRGIRKKIAENMQMAKHIIPHFTLMDEVCVDELVKLRTQAKAAAEKYGVKVTYLPFVMKALIATCREFPMFNASMDDAAGEVVYKKYFNVAFAADTPNGLMVPVVKNADFKTTLQISQEIQQLAGKAREGKLAIDDMKGATITVTNIGSVGGLYATPIINHPEVAILGMYKIETKPVWNGTKFRPAQMMGFTITCDHRLIDGAVAANFMKSFLGRIENPSQLMLDMI
ncbi:MAG: dihydrolipoamide acetyltransferase family protein [Bdellovibrionales bacterium]